MKKLNAFINEKLKMSTKTISKQKYNYFPKTWQELKELVKQLIKERGEDADLNDIDTSEIRNMATLFQDSNSKFNGDISKWDVSNVTYMGGIFSNSEFNGDISNWDVSKVENMNQMFAYSIFNGDISNWNISNVETMDDIFYGCPLKNNPPKWYKS